MAATEQCTCFEYGTAQPCSVHPAGIQPPTPPENISPEYLKGFRDGINTALEMMRGKNADK